MNIIILEDELIIAEHLKDLVESFGHKVIAIAQGKTEFFAAIENSLPDVALLDINIRGKHQGIEIAEKIKMKYHFLHIYITSFSDRKLIDVAAKTEPVSYIVKPFKESEVYAALQIASENLKIKENEPYLLIKSNNKTIKIYASEIYFIKSDNIYIELHTKQGRFLERTSLEKFLESYKFQNLIRVHRSYIVNRNHIKALKSSSIILDQYEIPVSRKYQKAIRETF
jgi:two-component system, LytTR family, response regulator LytT